MISRCLNFLLLSNILFLFTFVELRAEPISVPYTAGVANIDGVLDEAEWQSARQFDLQYVTSPFENTEAPVKTTAYLYEDGEHLYFAFKAEDPDPDKIRAFMRDRDSSWGEDLVGLKIDTFADGRLAYQFFVNPFGIQTDAIENEMTGNESSSWDAIWQSAGNITESGYVTEAKIPLGILNFAETDSDKTFAIEFVRFYPRKVNYRLSHIADDRDNACTLCQLKPVQGFVKAKQGSNLVVVPTAVLAAGRSRDPRQSDAWDNQNDQQLGLNLRWGLSPEITLSATLNPDFSQVEADVAQLSINNTFALFFDEQRPFFVENQDYFTSIFNLIYTRNINSPDYGVKLTGRMDKHSLGVFIANDESATFVMPGNLGSDIARIESKSNNLAARYRYDYSDDLSVGSVVTVRTADDYHNYMAASDIKYRITDKDTLRAQIAISETLYPENLSNSFCRGDCLRPDQQTESSLRSQSQEEFSGISYALNYRRETANYVLSANHTHIDEDFRADLGFESRVDRVKSVIGGQYYWWNEQDWWSRIRLRGDWDITHNMQGELLEKELEADVSILGDYQSYVQLGVVTRTRIGLRQQSNLLSIDGNTSQFEEDSASLYFESTPIAGFSIENFLRVGDGIDFTNNVIADQVYMESSAEFDIGTNTSVDLQHTYSKLDSNQMNLFVANLSDVRVNYQFDSRQLLRLTLAYSDIQRNPQNYPFAVQQDAKDFGFQLLYSYKLNPLTKFFVGVSQSAFDNDDLQTFKANNQSVFMKFSYAYVN